MSLSRPLLFLLLATPAVVAARLQLGVQGHCSGVGGQTPYRQGNLDAGVATQLSDVRELGPDNGAQMWYRNDVGCGIDANGTVDQTCLSGLVRFVKEAQHLNITVLPILFAPVARTFPDPTTSAGQGVLFAATAAAELYAFDMASALVAAGVTVFELSNELDNACIQLNSQGGAPNGNLPSMFNETKYQFFLAILRGLNTGVKRASPASKTIVNSGGWLHYGWYTRLVEQDQLDFDIIGYHWYSSMGDFNASGPSHTTPVLADLTKCPLRKSSSQS